MVLQNKHNYNSGMALSYEYNNSLQPLNLELKGLHPTLYRLLDSTSDSYTEI